MDRTTFRKNTIIFTGMNALKMGLSFLFRAILFRLAGQEAVGLYQMVAALYMTAWALTSGGLAIAVAKLVAERRNETSSSAGIRQVLRGANALALGCSFLGLIVLFFLEHRMTTKVWANPATLPIFRMLFFSLPIVAVTAVFRGYFQGIERAGMLSTTLLAEEIGQTVFTTLALLHVFQGNATVPRLATAIAFGCIVGEAIGLVSCLIGYTFHKPRGSLQPTRETTGRTLQRIIALALPVAATPLLLSAVFTLTAILIPTRLQAGGYTPGEAAAAYATLTGMAMTLLMVPAFFTIAIGTSLLPQLTKELAAGRLSSAQASLLTSFHWVLRVSLPWLAIVVLFGDQLSEFVYGSPSAGPLLFIMGWVGPFLHLQPVITASLQSLGRPNLPPIAAGFGGALGLVLLYPLTERFGIGGSALALAVSLAASGIFSLCLLEQHLPFFRGILPSLVKLSIAAALAGRLARVAYFRFVRLPLPAPIPVVLAMLLLFLSLRVISGMLRAWRI